MRIVFYNDFVPGIIADDGSIVRIDGLLSSHERAQDVLIELIGRFEALREELAGLSSRGGGEAASAVRLRQPVPRPGKIVCARGNYREGSEREPWPLDAFLKSPDAVIGPSDTVRFPVRDHPVFHHEAELAIVIGNAGKDFPADQAFSHVFGYTAFMDVSARKGLGRNDGVSFLGKSYDTFAPIGPCILTKDEVQDPNSLQVRYFVNDDPRHDYNTSDMEHPIPELLEFLGSIMTLKPGDVVACGTNHQQIGPLQHGDVARIEIEEIGEFSVVVDDPLGRNWERVIDQEMAQRVRQAPT
jgi:2-keto-4-pentenoate hydratase/2-oxohepta-3-ene-1,7-dioic acid hydratase in catechol pathway